MPHPLRDDLFSWLPSSLQSLSHAQEAQLLHEAREGHLRALLMLPFEHQCLLRVLGLTQGEGQRVLVARLLLAAPLLDLEVHVVRLQLLLGQDGRPIRVRWQLEPEGLQQLGEGQEVLAHVEGLAVHSSERGRICWRPLEKDDGQLPTDWLRVLGPPLLACDDLVLRHVEERRGAKGHSIYVTFLEDCPQVVAPCTHPGTADKCCRVVRRIHELVFSEGQVQPAAVEPRGSEPKRHLASFVEASAPQLLVGLLGLEVLEQLADVGRGLVVFQEVPEAQLRVEGLHSLVALLTAHPLPPSMDALCV